MHQVGEAGLVQAASDGDESAYACLVGQHIDVARRVAFLHAPRDEVDDIVQEALIRAWQVLPGLRTGESFRPWLVSIVANHARNRRRGLERRSTWESRAQDWGPESPMPDERVISNEEISAVLAAVAQLRDHERDVVAYRYFLDLSEAETAQALGVPVGTVKSRLSRGLGHLRAALEVTK